MAVLTATFETGVHGNAVAIADAGSATAWDVLNDPGAGSLLYDNTHVYETLAAKVSHGGAGARIQISWTTALGTVTDHYGRIYIYFTANPGNVANPMRVESTGAVASQIIVNSSGTIRMDDSAGQAVVTTNSISLNQWVRLEWHVIHSTTVGQVEVKLFNNPDSVSPTETQTSAASRNTLASANEIMFGSGAGLTYSDFWMDNIVANDTAYPGPAGGPPPSLYHTRSGMVW